MNYYENIKTEILNNEITKKVKDYSKNKSDLTTYYNVGKLLSEAGKHYGEGIIKEYSERLTKELNKKYSVSTLRYMRQFYENGIHQAVPGELTWSHYIELLPLKDKNKIKYYIDITIKNNLSTRQLRERIKNKEYERLDEKTKYKLIKHEETKVDDFVKNPIIIKNNLNYEIISEKVLQKVILEDIPAFLSELGSGFTFIRNEYPIKLGNNYNYIDLLLYNYEFNCFVVVELKVTDLKKDHIGQIEVYMNYIDNNLKILLKTKQLVLSFAKKIINLLWNIVVMKGLK